MDSGVGVEFLREYYLRPHTIVIVVDVQTQEALKELAHVLKHKIQTWSVTKEEKHLITDIESLLVVLRLLKTSWRRPGSQALQIFCAAWVRVVIDLSQPLEDE